MRNIKVRRDWRQVFWGALLSLYLAAPAYAFTPSDSPLLSAAAVTPNVMLLIDDSGSMNNIIWASGFDPTVSRSTVYTCNRSEEHPSEIQSLMRLSYAIFCLQKKTKYERQHI